MKRAALLLALLLLAAPASAATVTHEDSIGDTGATPNTSNSFTPAANDLLVVFVTASGTVQDPADLTSSAGTTFAQIGRGGSANSTYVFIANSFSAASAQTVTFDSASDPATGTVIQVMSVTGMFRTGTSASRQVIGASGGAGTTPAPAFSAAALTGNVTVGAVGNSSNPAGMTQPTGWTEQADAGFITPTTGMEYVTRDSGFTGTTVTWGSTSATAWVGIILELDTSAAPSTCANWIALLGAGCK